MADDQDPGIPDGYPRTARELLSALATYLTDHPDAADLPVYAPDDGGILNPVGRPEIRDVHDSWGYWAVRGRYDVDDEDARTGRFLILGPHE